RSKRDWSSDVCSSDLHLMSSDPDIQRVASILNDVREHQPVIHCITATVSMSIVADGLLAAGARPMMTETLHEAPVLTTVADALRSEERRVGEAGSSRT